MNVDEFIGRCYRGELLSESEMRCLCERAKNVLMNEPNVPRVPAPVTVVGDIHGQLYDLLELFRVGGRCPETNYLFLGDYVDRGHHSVQTIALLVCLKVRYPQRIFLLRGNHETRQITQVYGFYAECMRKYGTGTVWKYFTDLFDYLAIAAVIDDSIFCVHGGLSPSVHTVDQIATIHRFQEIPHEGAMSDLVWSDPDPVRDGFNPSNRGAGFSFGADVVNKFLCLNGLKHVLRAHQLCMEGFQVLFDDQLSTVWSAPNYCYRCGNLACALEIEQDLTFHFNVFSAAPESERPQPPAPDGPTTEYFL